MSEEDGVCVICKEGATSKKRLVNNPIKQKTPDDHVRVSVADLEEPGDASALEKTITDMFALCTANINEDRSQVRDKNLVENLSAVYIGSDYLHIIDLEKRVEQSVLQRMKEAGGFCLPNFVKKGLNTWFAIDNIDLLEDTPTGQGTFHGTVVVMFQQDKNGEFMNRPLEIPEKLLSHKPLAFDVNMVQEPVIKTTPLRLSVYEMGKRKNILSKDFTHTWALANYLTYQNKEGKTTLFEEQDFMKMEWTQCKFANKLNLNPCVPLECTWSRHISTGGLCIIPKKCGSFQRTELVAGAAAFGPSDITVDDLIRNLTAKQKDCPDPTQIPDNMLMKGADLKDQDTVDSQACLTASQVILYNCKKTKKRAQRAPTLRRNPRRFWMQEYSTVLLCFTGCDTNFRFLRQREEISMGGLECLRGGDGGLQQLHESPLHDCDSELQAIPVAERFTVIIYNKTSNLDSVGKRHVGKLFSQKKKGPKEKIPPRKKPFCSTHCAQSTKLESGNQ
ncbi:hypothetical protein GWK47_022583 [Chionoecetes opilio]|uniref:Uncharacterized protein n=1 Tax=Chionoecetes opilio TaxID=41210 RepID=A0A8J5CK41_CHIOP|nr:hypothetical protein GWK47_022583 [Chionoecetes opilio]